MKNSRPNSQTVLFILATFLIAAAAQAVYYYPQLPDKIPSHITVTGEVDDYMVKSTFFILMLSTIFGTAVFLTLGSLLVLTKAPQLVNLPHKEYWFAPERKQETIAFVFMINLKLTIATTLMMMAIFQSIIWIGIGSPVSPTTVIWTSTGLLCAYFLLIIIKLNRRFKLPEAAQETPT